MASASPSRAPKGFSMTTTLSSATANVSSAGSAELSLAHGSKRAAESAPSSQSKGRVKINVEASSSSDDDAEDEPAPRTTNGHHATKIEDLDEGCGKIEVIEVEDFMSHKNFKVRAFEICCLHSSTNYSSHAH